MAVNLMAHRRHLIAKNMTDGSLLYRLSAATVFDGTSPIDTGVAILPTDRDLTILADFTPSASMTSRGFLFYDGLYESPLNYLGLEFQSPEDGWTVSANGDTYSLTNVSAGKRHRLAIRKTAGSNVLTIQCNDGDGTVSGTLSVTGSMTATETMVLGAYRYSSGASPYIGTISDFRAYSRRLTDKEVTAFLNAI